MTDKRCSNGHASSPVWDLRIYTGSPPEILEYIPGMILDEKTQLGVNTVLGSSGTGHHFTVILDIDDKDKIDLKVVRGIIESQKPAHTSYTLQTRNIQK